MHLRLNLTFLVVLGVSILGTAIAAWAITFTSSHSRVLLMASDFTSLAETTGSDFSGLVSELLQNSSNIVNYILELETQAGVSRISSTEAQVNQSSQQLLTFARNSTAQSSAQLQQMVVDVGGFISGVITDFETIAGQYAVELRYEFAMKAQTALENLVQERVIALMRLPTLAEWGFVDPNKPLDSPFGLDDATILAALCAYSAELGTNEELTWTTGTGRFYDCISSTYARLLLTVWNADGTTYNQTWGAWHFGGANISNWQQYFLNTPIQVYTPAGVNCRLPFVCRNQNTVCGFAPACRPNIIPYLNVSVPELLFTSVYDHYYFHIPFIGITYNMVNQSLAPSPMEAVFTYALFFASIDAFLADVGTSPGTRLALILNDTDLTAVGSVGDKCAPGAPLPGPASQPTWSVLRSCDNRTRALGNWLLVNQANLTNNQTSVLINDTLWDVFVSTTYGLNYYVAVGMELSAMYGAIWASEATATAALGNLSASQSAALTALSVHTNAYMQGLEAANLQQIQSTYTTLVAELASLTTTSQQLLNNSQAASTATISHMLVQQMAKVDEVQTTQLTALNVTTAWTIAVVVGIFLVVLSVSAFGTMRLTASLAEIIALMESVAEMNVEQLEVPQDAPVVEVARIQRAFHVLVKRLVEYKTYMPAALFNSGSHSGGEEDHSPPECPLKRDSTTDSSAPTPMGGPTKGGAYRNPSGSRSPTASASNRKAGRRNVAVLVVNVIGFRDFLAHEPNLMALFSAYVKTVHRAVSQARGNIDSIVGDQILVTFNAHISCGDPVGAAVNAALELTTALKGSATPFRCQMGVSCGPMLYGSAGYANFRTLVALGTPMKLASLLARLSQFDSEVVLCDSSVSDRIGFTHAMQAVDLVTLPREKPRPKSYAVFAVIGKKNLEVDEWMYQLDQSRSTWETVFAEICKAKTVLDARKALMAYQQLHPNESYARRLASRLHAWTPGLGLPLCDAADVAPSCLLASPDENSVVELAGQSPHSLIGSSRKV